MDEQLIKAARQGNTEQVRDLLDRGADIHAKNDGALKWAAESGHTETVQMLLDRGATVTDELISETKKNEELKKIFKQWERRKIKPAFGIVN